MEKLEYEKMMGLNQKDIGSVYLLRKEVVRLSKARGNHTQNFYSMKKPQLLEIYKRIKE